MAPRDPVGLALAAIGSGAFAGAGVITAGIVALRILQHGGAAVQEGRLRPGFEILWISLLAGTFAAVFWAWKLATPISDTWRRGVTAALAAFGGLMLAAVTAPVDMLGGLVGLAFYLVATVSASILLARKAFSAGQNLEP